MRALWALLLCSVALSSVRVGASGVEYASVASVNHVMLQHPAPGAFSLAELKWVYAPAQRVGMMLTAVIPAGRVPDLRTGEAARAGTNEPPKETSGAKANRADRYVCQRAASKPRKPREKPAAGAAPDKPNKHRGPGLAHGEDETSLKVGCPVAFNVKIEGDFATVRCTALKHAHPTNTSPRYHPDWIKPWIANEYNAASGKVNAAQLMEQIRQISRDATIVGLGFEDWDEALDAFDAGDAQPSRDALCSMKYVQAALTALNKDKNAFLSNPCQSLAHWVDQHEADVFMYSPGETLAQGEEEHVRALRGAPSCAARARRRFRRRARGGGSGSGSTDKTRRRCSRSTTTAFGSPSRTRGG